MSSSVGHLGPVLCSIHSVSFAALALNSHAVICVFTVAVMKAWLDFSCHSQLQLIIVRFSGR